MEIQKALQRLLQKGNHWTKIVVIAGLIGMLLLLLSSFWPKSSGSKSAAEQTTQMSTEEYAGKLEEKVQQIIGQIHGVGTAKVMVTLENGVENVYANSEKKSTDNTTDSNTSGSNKATDKNNTEETVVVIDGKDGKQALVVTQKEPTVKGVVIVCDGGDNLKVKQDVIEAVTTALKITSNRVSVVKSSGNS